MARFNIEAFEKLIIDARESTIKAVSSSPFLSKGKSKVEGAEKVANLKPGLIFDISEDDTTHSTRSKESSITVAVNWLVKIAKSIIEKVNEHAELIKFNHKHIDKKADREEVTALEKKYELLEVECDEVRQRGLKGNLIISSPDLQNKKSLLTFKTITDPETKAARLEDETELCCRLILLKTGVTVPLRDISACHPLARKGSSTSYIIRFTNRRPGSAWDTLAAGLLTGKNKDTKAYFTDANVFINFQLTKNHNALAKAIRDAKREKKLFKYGCDQNGKFTVKFRSESRWQEVKSKTDLEEGINQIV